MHVSQYPLFQIKGSIQITAPGRGWKPCPPDPTSASGSCLPPLSRCLSDTCNVPGFMPVLGLTDKWGQCGSCPQGICNPVIIWKSPSSMKETRYCVEKEGHWGAYSAQPPSPLYPSWVQAAIITSSPAARELFPCMVCSSSTVLLEISFWKKTLSLIPCLKIPMAHRIKIQTQDGIKGPSLYAWI